MRPGEVAYARPMGASVNTGVIIATSGGRTSLLVSRALLSVYRQVGVAPESVRVLVVDDNVDSDEVVRVKAAIDALRDSLGLEDLEFPTVVVRNARTRRHSGTGAWNTGLDLLATRSRPPEWVAILDDDDEFLPEHLVRCSSEVDVLVDGVFERLEWVRSDRVEARPFTAEDLTPEAFFVGNPGVQGSNLFVRLGAVRAVGGFDESLPNTTDRDLMIRLLRYTLAEGRVVRALPTVGVRHFDHDGPRVNTDLARKREGLDLFYAKHSLDFEPGLLAASLERARRLFEYPGLP